MWGGCWRRCGDADACVLFIFDLLTRAADQKVTMCVLFIFDLLTRAAVEKVTISKKGLAQLLQMLGSTFELPANEITPSVPPLAPESKESDTQEKKAAPEGENEPSIAELMGGTTWGQRSTKVLVCNKIL